MYESIRLMEILEKIRENEYQTNIWCKPHFIEFTTLHNDTKNKNYQGYPLRITQKTNERYPGDNQFYDLIMYDKKVTITIYMPDTKKDNLKLRVTENVVELTTNKPKEEYFQLIKIPCRVESSAIVFTYKNGVLDIILSRKKTKEK